MTRKLRKPAKVKSPLPRGSWYWKWRASWLRAQTRDAFLPYTDDPQTVTDAAGRSYGGRDERSAWSFGRFLPSRFFMAQGNAVQDWRAIRAACEIARHRGLPEPYSVTFKGLDHIAITAGNVMCVIDVTKAPRYDGPLLGQDHVPLPFGAVA